MFNEQDDAFHLIIMLVFRCHMSLIKKSLACFPGIVYSALELGFHVY